MKSTEKIGTRKGLLLCAVKKFVEVALPNPTFSLFTRYTVLGVGLMSVGSWCCALLCRCGCGRERKFGRSLKEMSARKRLGGD